MIKKTLRKSCPNTIQEWYADIKYYLRFKLYPQGLANEMHRGIVGYDINWKDPQTLNEKINWMKFYGDTSLWASLADKIKVREYIKERIGEDILPKLYGVWENANDIDFCKLPRRFVLKTNHGCGTVIPVADSNKLDKEKAILQLNTWLEKPFGYDTVEPHYLKIKPLVYAEEFLDNDSNISSSLIDYKVHCFNGKAYYIMCCTDRILGQHATFSFYDIDWHPLPEFSSDNLRDGFVSIPRPSQLDALLKYAEVLAKGHPLMRVDFYIIQDRIVFGEITMTPQGGYLDYLSSEGIQKMGALVTLPKKRK